MARYIDAEKLKHLVNEKNYYTINKHFFFDCIIECDTEDVAPVIHAKWNDNGANYKCSNCGNTEPYYDMLYCPHCGALMIEENQDAKIH